MVILKRFLVAVSFPAILVGCAGPEITQMDVALEASRASAENRRIEAKAMADEQEILAISRLDPVQQGMAFMAKQMREMTVALTDKGKQQMGFYDMKANVAAQQNTLIDKTTGRILKASVVGGAIWAANDLAQHGIDKAGDKVTMTGDNNTTEINRVDAKSKTSTRQVGDANSTGPSDAQANGPDKSSTVTEVVAPEEPVVEEPVGEEGEFVPTEPPAEFDDEPIDIPEVPEEAK